MRPFLVGLAAFALLAAPAAAQTQPVDTTPTIAADGSGTATLTPDVADFAAGVERIAPTSTRRPQRGQPPHGRRAEGGQSRRASPMPTSAPSGSRSSASASGEEEDPRPLPRASRRSSSMCAPSRRSRR